MLELAAIGITSALWTFIAFCLGVLLERRKNRRENAATASCVACEWTSGPVPLSEAFRLAEAHTAMPHPAGTSRTLVERAQ